MKKTELKTPSYPTFNEFNRKKFLNIATAVGIGATVAAISLDLAAEEKKIPETEKAENPDKKIKDEVVLLVAGLGNKDFKERDKATQSLIVYGKKFTKEKQPQLTEFLKGELQKSCKSKDPEVKERAKKILLAITPPPPQPPNNIIVGKIRVKGKR